MIALLEDMMTVWTLAGFVALCVGGFLVGSLYLSRLRTLTSLSARQFQVLVFESSAFVGSVFYVGQIIDSLIQSPDLADRVISRYLLWLMFSLALSVGSRHRFWR